MIIFGTKGVTYTKQSTTFHCPSCGESPGKHKRVRTFFTLYFIPLIPLNLQGEYAECQTCKGTYDIKILDYDPSGEEARFEAEFHGAIRRVMIQMLLADGNVDDREVETVREIYQQIAGTEISRQALRDQIATIEADHREVEDYLSELGGHLNDHGKEMVIRSAFLVAAADGEFHEDERALLEVIGKFLQMSPAHIKGVIADATTPLSQA